MVTLTTAWEARTVVHPQAQLCKQWLQDGEVRTQHRGAVDSGEFLSQSEPQFLYL